MPSLYKALIPISKAYVNAAGYRKVGLKYDDLIIEERRDVEKVRKNRRFGQGKNRGSAKRSTHSECERRRMGMRTQRHHLAQLPACKDRGLWPCSRSRRCHSSLCGG